jgi:hypothetical protein
MAGGEHRPEIKGMRGRWGTRPLLSAVVIYRQDNIPGNGFFQMAQNVGAYTGGDRYIFFIEELRRVHDYWRQQQIV